MFGFDNFKRVRANFADQFEPVGEEFLFRLHGKSAPIRVSAVEREGFLADFDRFLKVVRWLIPSVTIGVITLILGLQFKYGFSDAVEARAIWVSLLCGIGIFLIFYFRANRAPAIALRDRPPEGGERSREEVRRRSLAKLSYGQILLPLVLAALMLWRVGSKGGLLVEQNSLWLLIAVGIVALTLFSLFRKWRVESEK